MAERPPLSVLARELLAATDLAKLAAELFRVHRVGREISGNCPLHDDRSPSFSLNAENGRYYCFGCQAKGDLFDLVGHVWGIKGFRDRLDAVSRWGGLTCAPDRHDGRDVPRSAVPKPVAKVEPRKAVARPEVEAVWSQCQSVIDDPAVSDYLSGRGLDPCEIAERDLARALPEGITLPFWASCHRTPWNRSHHRLVARLFDFEGQLASLTARRIVEVTDEFPKALFPHGPRTGLVLADDAGRWLLRSPEEYLPAEIWIGEGLTDHLGLACDFTACDEKSPGALAIVGPGSWSRTVADRIPDHIGVVVAVHSDQAGERYLAEIVNTFKGRPVRMWRWTTSSSGPRS